MSFYFCNNPSIYLIFITMEKTIIYEIESIINKRLYFQKIIDENTYWAVEKKLALLKSINKEEKN